MAALALAHIDQPGLGAGEIEDRLRRQPVVHHDIGLAQQTQGLEGEEFGIAGARADQMDLARTAPLLRPIDDDEAPGALAMQRLAGHCGLGPLKPRLQTKTGRTAGSAPPVAHRRKGRYGGGRLEILPQGATLAQAEVLPGRLGKLWIAEGCPR